MHETFLYYLWAHQYFDKHDLMVNNGENLIVYDPGKRNHDAGPDFLDARIRMESLEWRGSVELHVRASDWVRHKHSKDPAYENVVLHVVWEDDRVIARADGSPIPTIALKNRVDTALIARYQKLSRTHNRIPCAALLHSVTGRTWAQQLDRALLQRLETKGKSILEMLEVNNADWEETCYQLLCRNFGFKVNADSFLELARALPYKILLKHANERSEVEALMFGVGGFLEGVGKDDYGRNLASAYRHLSRKYGLDYRQIHPARWRFLRLRPANFPTVRLAQAAALFQTRKSLFSKLVSARDPQEVNKLLRVEVSPYWKDHYRFSRHASAKVGVLGDDAVNNLMMNTMAPLLFAYGMARGEKTYQDGALRLLKDLPAEQNAILRRWREIGVGAHRAYESQALLEQQNEFCVRRRCLDCMAGMELIRPSA